VRSRKLVQACAGGTKAKALASEAISVRRSAPRQRSGRLSVLEVMASTFLT
jgi:hypothetical protein